MVLVGDPAQVRPAARTRLPRTAVDGEVLAQLRRETSGAGALRGKGTVHHETDRGQKSRARSRVEFRELRGRREQRLVQGVVRVATAQTADGPLVTQDRMDPAVVIRRQDPRVGLGRADLRTQGRERAVVAGLEHPPSSLALRPELLHQDARAALHAEPHHGPARLRGLRWILDVDAASLGEVDQEAPATREPEDQELAEARHTLDEGALEFGGTRRVGLQRRELQRVRARELGARGDLVQALSERAHLR